MTIVSMSYGCYTRCDLPAVRDFLWACTTGIASAVLRAVLEEYSTGTSNAAILPDDSLGHVPAALVHSEYLSFPCYPSESVTRVFSPYAHLILLVTSSVSLS